MDTRTSRFMEPRTARNAASENRVDDAADASPPSDAWLFAKALRGEPVVSKEQLREFVAAISSPQYGTRTAAGPSTDVRAFAKALRGEPVVTKEQVDEFVAAISTVHEGTYDPSKHPRAPKGQPDGGQWIEKGGGGGAGGGSVSPITTTAYSGPKGVVAQQVSWHPPVGHHWAPYSVVFQPDIRRLLSDDAIAYAMGAYSGPTVPPHGNETYGGITHPQYNGKVNEELKKFLEARKIKKMTVKQMEEFIGLINNGLGANGKAHDQIAAFNKAIREALPKGPASSSKMEDILAAGRKYMKTSRFRLLAAGAVVSGLLGELLQKHVDALHVAAKSGHYQRALRALQDGDLAKAHLLLTGDDNSLYSEILHRVGPHAALNFKIAMDKVFETTHNRVYK